MQRKTPKMTRAHFELIADTINNLAMFQSEKETVALAFCIALKSANPTFNHYTFYERATRLNDDV